MARGGPAGAIHTFNRVVTRDPEPFATAVCAVWWPLPGTLRVANAGHVPPVLVDVDGAALLGGNPDPPLGLVGRRSVAEHHVRRDAALLFCTDGLIERRRGSLDHGLAALVSVLDPRSPEEISAGSVLEAMVDELGPLEDDVTVVVVRTDSASHDRPAVDGG